MWVEITYVAHFFLMLSNPLVNKKLWWASAPLVPPPMPTAMHVTTVMGLGLVGLRPLESALN